MISSKNESGCKSNHPKQRGSNFTPPGFCQYFVFSCLIRNSTVMGTPDLESTQKGAPGDSVATARLESRKSIKSSRNGVSRSRGYGSRLLMTKPRLSCGLDPKKETISIFQYSEDLRLSGHIKCAL